jgi:hypothetical protein
MERFNFNFDLYRRPSRANIKSPSLSEAFAANRSTTACLVNDCPL